MTTRVGVVVFPGSNCEHDVVRAVTLAAADADASEAGAVARAGADADAAAVGAVTAELVFHDRRTLDGLDAVVLPGGFAHGDYLRPGALARFSPVMEAVTRFAADGGPVVGICNGFQVLTEAGLLPGALQKNAGLRFLCTTVPVVVCSDRSALTSGLSAGATLSLPINHFEGNYTCDADTLEMLRAQDRVVLRYAENPNGSVDDIAGVCNEAGNVVGLMPHPERACDPLTGNTAGLGLFRSLLSWAQSARSIPARDRTLAGTPAARQAL